MINTTIRLLVEYDIRFDNRCRIFVAYLLALKDSLDEDTNYEQQISFLKKSYPSVYDLQFLQQSMFVILVPFSKEHKNMLEHCKELLEYQNGMVAIHPRFNKLTTSLRTAVENGEDGLVKIQTSFDNVLDSFRMSLQFWH